VSLPPHATVGPPVPIRGERFRYAADAGGWSHWSAQVEIELSPPPAARFVRGDPNGDGGIDLSDAVTILFSLFLDGRAPACAKSADADDDGSIGLNDAMLLLHHLYLGGAPPDAPFPECGEDPTADELPCPSHPQCP
jgi:hypothetical protein